MNILSLVRGPAHFGRVVLIGVICTLSVAATASAAATSTLLELRAANQELTSWLEQSDHGRGWMHYLKTSELQRQLALELRADAHAVEDIHARFAAQHPGLELPPFRSVHAKLDVWLAELSRQSTLPRALRAARDSFQRPKDEEVARSWQALRRKIDSLSDFLGGHEHAAAWKRYLRWSDLLQQTQDHRGVKINTLREIRELFAASQPGLDWPQFSDVRKALDSYLLINTLAQDATAARAFTSHLETLAAGIQQGDLDNAAVLQKLNHSLQWIERHEQIPDLALAVRTHLGQVRAAPAATAPPAATPVARLMSAAKEKSLRQLLPRVDDEALRRVLADPALILYTDAEMPRTYQIWDGSLQGVHLASYNISADRAEPHGNGNHEFPWNAPAGTHHAQNASSFRFISLPRDEQGKPRPIVWYRKQLGGDEQASYVWTYPVGAVVGEVLLLRGPDGYDYTYEMRLRFRKTDRWGVDVFRPFPTADDLARRIRELRPAADKEPKLAQLLRHVEQPQELPWRQLADQQPGQRVFHQSAGVDTLPALDDDKLVAELLTSTTFTSSLDRTWRVGSNGAWTYAPTTQAKFHVVPANYEAGFVEVNARSCLRCHSTANQHVRRFNFGRDWYGRVRGADGIFSFHPFDPGTVSGNGMSSGVQMRAELIQAGVLESYDSRKHAASHYTAIPDFEG